MYVMPLKRLEFALNEFAMPFYAVEKYYSSPQWAQEQMKLCIPELEKDEDLRNQYAGFCWMFREGHEPEIVVNPHDELIACSKAGIEVIPVRIGVPQRRSFVETRSMSGVSMTITGGRRFTPDSDFQLDAPALHVSTACVVIVTAPTAHMLYVVSVVTF